jgi:uncharacterized protein (TIGR00295 family)
MNIDFKTVYKIENSSQEPRQLPTKEQALQLQRELYIEQNIINHEIMVLREARELAYNIKKVPINLDLVKAGAIIHDIGRFKVHGFHHGPIGADFLRYLKYPEELARIVEKHTMAGLTPEEAIQFHLPERDYLPRTLEEKIVCLADKYVMGTHKVTIQERFQRWIDRYGETEFLKAQIARAKKLEEEILKLIF